MWRNLVICVLAGLLIATSVSSLNLLRQTQTQDSQLNVLRARVAAAEATSSSGSTDTSTQSEPAQSASAGAANTPQSVSIAPAATPRPTIIAVPEPTVTSADSPILKQIEAQVTNLRGLQPKTQVPIKFLDQQALQQLYVNRYNQDYTSDERESDQKLLTTLGLVGPNQSVEQILLDVVNEQIIGLYNDDDKTMYMLSNNGQFGPDEKDTFAQEYDHALQDQYFDLNTLAPKHPTNDDRSLAIEALTEGDSTLVTRLWGQQNLTPDELSEVGQSGDSSKLLAAPTFLREQLLFPYSDGFNFIRQIYQSGGYAAVDDVFRDPPQSTAQVLHIDKYRNHVAPVEVDLPDLSQGQLGNGWRQISSNVFGELDLRLILTQLTDSTTGVRGASGWSGDRWELLENNGKQALAIKSVWDSEADATTFFKTFSQAMQNRFFGAQVVEASSSRQALTATNAATDVRQDGATVYAVISFDRPTADAIAEAITS